MEQLKETKSLVVIRKMRGRRMVGVLQLDVGSRLSQKKYRFCHGREEDFISSGYVMCT